MTLGHNTGSSATIISFMYSVELPNPTDAIINLRSLHESLRSVDKRYLPDQILIRGTDRTARGEDPKAPSDVWA